VTELKETVTEALILKIGEGGEETITQPKVQLAKLFKDWDLYALVFLYFFPFCSSNSFLIFVNRMAKLKPLKQQLTNLMPDRFFHPRKLNSQHVLPFSCFVLRVIHVHFFCS
jgi:hypothetical protein